LDWEVSKHCWSKKKFNQMAQIFSDHLRLISQEPLQGRLRRTDTRLAHCQDAAEREDSFPQASLLPLQALSAILLNNKTGIVQKR
jgi:hypothetical protein